MEYKRINYILRYTMVCVFSDSLCQYFSVSNGKKRKSIDIFRAQGGIYDLHNCIVRQRSISGIDQICFPSFNSDRGLVLSDIEYPDDCHNVPAIGFHVHYLCI